jgi:hypothetical protein
MILLAGAREIVRVWSPPDPQTQNLPKRKLRSGYFANGDDIHPAINCPSSEHLALMGE